MREQHGDATMLWGYFWAWVNLPVGDEFGELTLEHVAKAELNAVERLLESAKKRGINAMT